MVTEFLYICPGIYGAGGVRFLPGGNRAFSSSVILTRPPGGWELWGSLIVVSALDDGDLVFVKGIDQPVLLSYSSRPIPFKLKAEGFWFSNPLFRIPADCQAESDDPFQDLRIVLFPPG